MEDYSALKRKEILTIIHYNNATIWINPEDIMLSESSLSQKDRYCVVPLTCRSQIRGTESRTVVTRDWREGRKGIIALRVQSVTLRRKKSSGDRWW